MIKNILLLTVLLVASFSLTDKEILQQTLNGLFEQNKLADPKTVVPCFDDATAHNTVVFIGQILDKAARGSISDLISLKDLIEKFGDSIPQKVKDCLNDNAEFTALGAKYGITPDTDKDKLEKKIIAYVTLHYLQVHGWLGKLNDNWKAGKYYQVGYDGATYGHSVLNLNYLPELSNRQILQQLANGIFEQNQLADPTTVVQCFDDETAGKTVTFIGQLLEKAARGSPSDLIQLRSIIQNFGQSLPQKVKDCLDGNAELIALGAKYGVTPDVDPQALLTKIFTYVVSHYLTVHKWFGQFNDSWRSGKYYQTGYSIGKYGHNVLSMTEQLPQLSDKEILQQALNGLFEQNGLADPTTIVQCFDDATAHNTVVFAGQLLDKAARGSISDLLSLKDLVQKFGQSIPQPVKDCLDGNAQFTTLGTKYGITPDTDMDKLQKKIIAYVTLHYLQVHGWLGSLNNNWKGGKYYQVGFDGAGYGHKVLNITPQEVRELAKL